MFIKANQRSAFPVLMGTAVIFQILTTLLLKDNPQTWVNWGNILVFGITGYLGIRYFEEKAGFPDMLDRSIKHFQRFGYSAGWGMIFAVLAILFDYFSREHVPQIPFPASLVAYIPIAIADNMFWRLFLLTFLVWLFSCKIIKTEITVYAFRIITLLEAALYILIQLNLYRNMVAPLSLYSVVQILIVSGGFMVTACVLYRRYGFLAPVTMHTVQYILYHGIYGGLLN